MNLITNSTFKIDGASTLITPVVGYGSGTVSAAASSIGKGLPKNTLTITQATNETGIYMDVTLEPNKDYVFSFYAKILIGDRIWWKFANLSGTTATTIPVPNTVSGEYDSYYLIDKNVKRYELSFHTSWDTRTCRIYLYEADDTSFSAEVSSIQLETGEIASAFEVGPDEILLNLSSGYPATLQKVTLNTKDRCYVTLSKDVTFTLNSGGILPFDTTVEDTSSLFPMTSLSTGDADTNTASHLLDANGTDWTTIEALLAPLLFPVYEESATEFAIADTVAAHDITLSKDIFPDGNETYLISDCTLHVATTGLYYVYATASFTAEADKHYKLEVTKGIATPSVLATTEFDTAATGVHDITFSGILSLTAADRVYLKFSSDSAGTVVVTDATFSVVKI